ncbi:MAG TPA: phospholipase D-like domain-containing protein [Thermoanaerobaculia bacterium]|jgi:cardiolipin synthase|nr:phospholipase D-like domain-containing protein [Thermoanaerobaculia bacterium]
MSRHRLRTRLFQPLLHPPPGRKLPEDLEGRKVERLAKAIPEGLRDPAFETLMRRIDGAPLFGGNEVEVYVRGDDAFTAMRAAVQSAQKEILLESYIYKDDKTGRAFLDDLAAAAARGVTVKVLADAAGSFSTSAAFWQEMGERGIENRLFHPLFKQIWYQPFRDHRKILIIDGQTAFTGGMNIGEEYGSAVRMKKKRKPGDTWRDTHVRVIGPAAWEMAIVFSEGWNRAGGSELDLQPLAAEQAEGAPPRILVLDSRFRRGQAESAAAMKAVVAAARESVWITNAYFAPGWAAVRVLSAAARRGVDVRLMLPGNSDVPLARHAGHGYYSRLLNRGVKIFEYQASILHAKTLVADGYVSVIGSTNLDFRSFLFNAECDLMILDEAVAGRMTRAFEEDMKNAEEIKLRAWRRRPFLHRLGDRIARWTAPLL